MDVDADLQTNEGKKSSKMNDTTLFAVLWLQAHAIWKRREMESHTFGAEAISLLFWRLATHPVS
jgi:hypothetical protein